MIRNHEQTTFFCDTDSAPAYVFHGMTPEEKSLMQQHVVYTHGRFAAGKVLIFGPVMASTGAFGMAVFEAADEAGVRGILENDPTVKAGLNKFEIHAMRIGAAQGFGAEAKA